MVIALNDAPRLGDDVIYKTFINVIHLLWMLTFIIPPATKLGGYTGITLSVRPSVCPSVDARAVR